MHKLSLIEPNRKVSIAEYTKYAEKVGEYVQANRSDRRLGRLPIPGLMVMLGMLMLGCGGQETEVAPPDPVLKVTQPEAITPLTGSGTLTGVATLAGVPPERVSVIPNKDTEVCGAVARFSDDLLLGPNQEIKNVVVSITNLPGPVPLNTAVEAMMDQKGCVFTPHLVQVAVGAPMTFLNNDRILHNIHTESVANEPINQAQPGFMKKMTETFAAPEVIKVKCDVHDWMFGYIVVQEHPYYAITDGSGKYTLSGLTDGSYELRFWHERLGEQRKTVVIKDGAATTVDVAFNMSNGAQ